MGRRHFFATPPEGGESKEDRLAWLREQASEDAFEVEEDSGDTVLRLAYRLNEESDDQRKLIEDYSDWFHNWC